MERHNMSVSHIISNAIFTLFPGYLRGVVVAEKLQNGPSCAELIQLMRGAEETVCQKLTLETLIEDPHIKPWREAFRSFGAKPSEFRPSIEGLTRRALRHEPLPSINTLVDIGNIVSLRHLLPAGGHSIENLCQDMHLRLADGTENFIPFGSDQVEHPIPGEVVFTEGTVVLTRRWVWRQANHTLTLPETTALEFNVDSLPPFGKSEVEQACLEMIQLITQFCGGIARYEILSQDHPGIILAV
jgi:DNA/RNA-binding domain of Phe-tRNA-synthetase-like protein